jgi:hypothetical protein
VDQSWDLVKRETHSTDNGPLAVDEYQVTALDTGEQHAVHIAGDVVLAAPGIELEDLQSPPSVFRADPGAEAGSDFGRGADPDFGTDFWSDPRF